MISLSHQMITLDLSTASTYNRWLLNTSCHWYMGKQVILTQIVERTQISFIWPHEALNLGISDGLKRKEIRNVLVVCQAHRWFSEVWAMAEKIS